ncbi:MAG: 2,3-diphosphoglycerate-dependent phosphoglycerate mutase [Bacilli bacterium]|nr:2,3-diphosphoglycerate-dependent phosphoglycerate mutase [Bacilli bacterium]
MKLILLRHGQSVWNKENKFTGWTDVELSDQGVVEAKQAGKLLKNNNIVLDIAFTSVLKRAIDTLNYVLEETNPDIPVKYSYKLNERHYGALQGLNKDETRQKYGDEQVHIWRRSADVRPPALEKDDPRFPGNDEKYKDIPQEKLPITENLVDTTKRVVEYYNEEVKPELKKEKNVIISAHGNSLRALIKHLENINDEEIMNVEIPTGKPYVYELDKKLNIIKKYYL